MIQLMILIISVSSKIACFFTIHAPTLTLNQMRKSQTLKTYAYKWMWKNSLLIHMMSIFIDHFLFKVDIHEPCCLYQHFWVVPDPQCSIIMYALLIITRIFVTGAAHRSGKLIMVTHGLRIFNLSLILNLFEPK